MKRIFLCFMCLVLLTGCLAAPQAPTEPTPTTTPSIPSETTLPPEQPAVPLLEQGTAAGETGNLLYIPNAHLESMACPEIRLWGNGLLLYEHTFSGMVMKQISLEDGRLLAETTLDVSPSAKVQIGSGFIGICDSGTGQVLILTEALEQEATYSVPQEGESWCLNQELESLFVFYPEQGLLCRDLASGETRWILEDAAFVESHGVDSGYALLSYTDRKDQKTYNRCLNLSIGTLETVPTGGSIASGTRSGDQWLLRQSMSFGEYLLIRQDTAYNFVLNEGTAQLLAGKRQLLLTDGTYRSLYLYDLDGHFLSRCTLPDIDYASVGTDLVWSGYWQGYFFRDTYENSAHLMFWDPSLSQKGDDLAMVPLGAAQTSEPVLEQALYQKAAELSQRYGLEIRIGEQCDLEYTHYTGELLADAFFVREGLETLERALSAYPEGFLQQLPYGAMQQIRIELVGDIQANAEADGHPPSVGGFAQARFDHYLIVLAGCSFTKGTVYHELSHVIDKRLEWDAGLRSDALFSEETWLSLQPEGFRYAMSYIDMPSSILAFENSGYFVREYSMTFPTEDRATLMALVMNDNTVLSGQSAMAEKMRYYAACIRDCFDTTGWPETTPWEPVIP